MEEVKKLIQASFGEDFVQISVSGPRKNMEVKKLVVRPVLIADSLQYQISSYTQTQVFHENLPEERVCERICGLMTDYKQVLIRTRETEHTVMIGKKGNTSIKRRSVTGTKIAPVLSHNRSKNYILKEGEDIPFLKDLGVMTAEGKIVNSRYDKFRQINRYLEYIRDVLPYLPKDREITILDFGCGKSYLTFAVYYYLKVMNGLDVRIIGLDLKGDVIRKCASLAKKYGYEKLDFLQGAIEDYEDVDHVDMVITLHACNTATDYALYKAVSWGAGVILSVPCCQHELNAQLAADAVPPVTAYGILKERYAAMLTDAIRADLLIARGYDTSILEFIDMEHTPKNLLIRGIFTGKYKNDKYDEVKALCREMKISPTLLRLFEEH